MNDRKFFIASVNDDGTYGEPVEITGEITPDLATGPDTTVASMFEGGEITGTFEVPRELAEQLEMCAWYQRKSAEKGFEDARKQFERPHGEWIDTGYIWTETGNGFEAWGTSYKCSECGNRVRVKKPFCDECGADMRKEGEAE